MMEQPINGNNTNMGLQPPYRRHARKTIYPETDAMGTYWTSPCVCNQGFSYALLNEAQAMESANQSALTTVQSDSGDAEEVATGNRRGEQWVCRTCYADPCVCGTRRAESASRERV